MRTFCTGIKAARFAGRTRRRPGPGRSPAADALPLRSPASMVKPAGGAEHDEAPGRQDRQRGAEGAEGPTCGRTHRRDEASGGSAQAPGWWRPIPPTDDPGGAERTRARVPRWRSTLAPWPWSARESSTRQHPGAKYTECRPGSGLCGTALATGSPGPDPAHLGVTEGGKRRQTSTTLALVRTPIGPIDDIRSLPWVYGVQIPLAMIGPRCLSS